MIGHSHLTGNVRVVGTWAAHALDRKVVNEWTPNAESCEEMKGKDCTAGTSSRANPKLHGDVGYANQALGRRVLGLERRGRRKG